MPKTTTLKVEIVKRNGLALSLSGGGYRATLFHLGLLRRLNELELLKSVEAISSVSGGSITAAQLALTAFAWKSKALSTDEWNKSIRDPLFNFCKNNIRTKPILVSLAKLWKNGVAVEELEKTYFTKLSKQTLGQLPKSVDFIFCSTDMIFSTNWYFRRKTSDNRRTGNHRAGYLKDWQDIPVARAVAASSCFPPLFGPMVLGKKARDFTGGSYRQPGRGRLIEKIRLSDGGIYDNLGVQPVWDAYRYLIVSDGGKPSPFTPIGVRGQVPRLATLLQNQIENLRRRMLFERSKSKCTNFDANLIAIDHGGKYNGYSKLFAEDVIANIRTDLDSFNTTEAMVLENHSYALADASIKKHIIPHLDKNSYNHRALASAQIPNPDSMNETCLRQQLRRSSKRSIIYKWRPL